MAELLHHPNLELAGANLVRSLGGIWHDSGGMCRCPAHEDHSPSLSVRVGTSNLLFKCFAGCTGIEVVRAIRRLNVGIPVERFETGLPPPTGPAVSDRASLALQLWEQAGSLSASHGETYLRTRGIKVRSSALRYLSRAPLGKGPGVRFQPAIIAAVQSQSTVIAVQRLFLDTTGTPFVISKMTLGRPLAGAVRLFEPGPVLGLAEGVETALSAAILLGVPVWASLGSERLSRIAIPTGVDRLILLPDNDSAGRRAASAAQTAYETRCQIETIWPWHDCKDWNDVLQAERPTAGSCGERLAIEKKI